MESRLSARWPSDSPAGLEIVAPGNVVAPVVIGGANWQNPSYDAIHSVMYVVALNGAMGYRSIPVKYEAGRQYQGGAPFRAGGFGKMGLVAIDTRTGSVKWEYPTYRLSMGAGALALQVAWYSSLRGTGTDRTGFHERKIPMAFPDRRHDRCFGHKLRSRRKAVRGHLRWKYDLQLCSA